METHSHVEAYIHCQVPKIALPVLEEKNGME